MQPVSTVQKGGAHTSYHGITCLTVCALVFGGAALGGAGDGGGLFLVGSEESFSMWNVPAASQREE